MAFKLPPLPPVQPQWGQFQVWWQQVKTAIEAQEFRQDELLEAIIAADAAAAAANAAAVTAQEAATDVQATADEITASNTLATSYVSGITVSAADAGADVTITISAHTRHYPQANGSTVNVAVNGGSLTARAYSTRYFITYADPSRAGGAVTYSSTTVEPAQVGDLHVVGSVLTPAAAGTATSGGYVRPPGTGSISYQ